MLQAVSWSALWRSVEQRYIIKLKRLARIRRVVNAVIVLNASERELTIAIVRNRQASELCSSTLLELIDHTACASGAELNPAVLIVDPATLLMDRVSMLPSASVQVSS